MRYLIPYPPFEIKLLFCITLLNCPQLSSVKKDISDDRAIRKKKAKIEMRHLQAILELEFIEEI